MFLCYDFYVIIMLYNQSLMSCMAKCAGEDDDNGKEATDLLIMKEFYVGAVGLLLLIQVTAVRLNLLNISNSGLEIFPVLMM